MSIQMLIIFGLLILQMSLLVVLLLPLPHIVRVRLIKISDSLEKNPNFTVVLVFSIILLGMQFLDCLNKLKRFTDHGDVWNHDQMASKFYAQRNLYLTGAVLYLYLAIYTVVRTVKKLVAKESEYRKLASVPQPSEDDEGEIAKYQQLIKMKEQDIAVFKKQVLGIQTAYDDLTPAPQSGSKKLD
ncbi:uncharacterized protein CANTADRAFT_279185 [Suhomyces tanzawaensis NRRL Y-17324]|uniref:Endoplasmic reticulum transmembrane protein n=1 Tax=Suhomyces tanzawaensis NRRL Y-17324 TaxID=984487 RepID=A0A1E4SDZ8_9ASCO|nr:uncharacterized protein CANTADRAFT_279185 [Suhomyces tanzawaensis NRRL Y-17324]ODV77686.1 hypothetical protein CANTADRAFT_279185 [Suhomyces tanzawaensis NRRL Y-17324]